MKYGKSLLKIGVLGALLVLLSVFIINSHVTNSVSKQVYSQTDNIPYNRVGLLLGSGKFLKSGYVNLFYQYRIDAAVALFMAGKIDYILVSGDNSNSNYDEPTTIKNDLIKGGIPENKITLDYAGFRTLDSVIRGELVFGLQSVTIISQKFHNERALYIANKSNIKAIAFNAKDVSKKYGARTLLREKLARVKMMLDLLFGKSPKYLGESISI